MPFSFNCFSNSEHVDTSTSSFDITWSISPNAFSPWHLHDPIFVQEDKEKMNKQIEKIKNNLFFFIIQLLLIFSAKLYNSIRLVL